MWCSTMKILALDIETNLAHSIIHCCGCVSDDVSSVVTHSKIVQDAVNDADLVVGHNIIDFDIPLLESLWGVTVPEHKVKDTLLMSRLWNPRIEGGHSLKSWGVRFNDYKGDIELEAFNKGFTAEMADYCLQDTKLTLKLYHHLTGCFTRSEFSDDCLLLEHEVQWITSQQVRNGFKLDVTKATKLYQDLWSKMVKAQDLLQVVFPPITTKRVSEKTGKDLKDSVQVFNAGSRPQIASRLLSKGVKLTEKTEKGAWKIDEKVLADVDTPEARLVLSYFLCQKRTGQIDQWLSHIDENQRVHGKVSTNGAVTGRMTHYSPNLAQIPSTTAPYGKECRSCWIVEDGNVLIGIDASGLELRMLAHYMNDAAYTAEVVDGDIHTANKVAAGLATRDQAKTFIYAFLYGAGAAKIGSITGGGTKAGTTLKKRFLSNTPALAKLIDKVKGSIRREAIIGLDKRKIRISSEHAALNSLLQSAGAIIMKRALVILVRLLNERNIEYKLVANVHDEWQIEAPEFLGKAVGKLGVKSIIEAGLYYNMRCPLDGAYNIGSSWEGTH